jgi:hypothetical protein
MGVTGRQHRRGGLGSALAAVAMLAVACGCGGKTSTTTDAVAEPAPSERTPSRDGAEPPAETVAPSHCPADLPSCRSAEGRIVYVERVDPDGDGDAHFVIRDPQGITLPELTAIDVRKGLRPHPLPGAGDQIHALELHVAGH